MPLGFIENKRAISKQLVNLDSRVRSRKETINEKNKIIFLQERRSIKEP